MKILIVDDDSFSRKILRNLLAKFEAEIFEAANGVEALDLIHKEEPQLVLLDVVMPVLNGLDTLQEIRTSAAFSRLPVVTVSARGERAIVMKFIDLGISGFLLKPLRPQETLRRLEMVIQQISSGGRAPGSRPRDAEQDHQPVLLLAERDPNFRQFAGPLLESRFSIVEAATGAAAWKCYNDYNPDVVLVGESLQLIGAKRLLEMIRSQPRSDKTSVYLLSESEEAAGRRDTPFDGILRRSFVPEIFSAEIARAIFGDMDLSGALSQLVREWLAPELVTATMQTIGVMTSQDVNPGGTDETARMHSEVLVRSELLTAGGEAAVIVGWSSDRATAQSIGNKILGAEMAFDEGVGDAIGELSNTIAGRVRASLAEKGFSLDHSTQHVETDSNDTTDWSLTLPFRTDDGETFVVAVAVEARESPGHNGGGEDGEPSAAA